MRLTEEKSLFGLRNIIIIVVIIGILLGISLLVLESFKSSVESTTSGNETYLDNVNIEKSLTQTPTSLTATRKNQTWLDFDGVDDYVNLTDKDIFSPSANNNVTTFSIWYKFPYDFSGVPGDYRNIFSKRSAPSNYEYQLHVFNSSAGINSNYTMFQWWQFDAEASNVVYLTSSSTGIIGGYKPDVWNNAIISIDGTHISTFMNGEAMKRSLITKVSNATGSAPLLIGSNDFSDRRFNGSIDDFRIYNNSFMPLQVANLRNSFSRASNLTYIPILMYHNIDNIDTTYYVNLTNFASQMSWLNASGYHTITDVEYYNWTQGKFIMPTNPIMLTFDDGKTNTYTNAAPIMDVYGYKGVIGIVTGLVPSGASTTNMNWTQINELIDKNWSIASHSQTHCTLGYKTGMSIYCNDSITRIGNLSQSKVDIITNTGVTPISFIYPGSDYGNVVGTSHKRWITYPDVMGNCSLNYSMCIGAYSTTSIPLYNNINSGFYTGDLNRILILNTTSISDFNYALNYTSPTLQSFGQWKLDENSGTTAYDVSGNGNNGTISGATWNNDGINITLTEDTDYTILGAVFTVINSDLAWTGIDISYNYIILKVSQIAITITISAIQTIPIWLPIIIILLMVGILLAIVFKIIPLKNSGEIAEV